MKGRPSKVKPPVPVGPYGVDIAALVGAVLSVAESKLRAAVRIEGDEHGASPVFGTGNRKTGAPGSYRRVGDAAKGEGTCPSDCGHLLAESCFGMDHHSAESAKRAGSTPSGALRSFAAAAAIGARRTVRAVAAHVKAGQAVTDSDYRKLRELARLHVVGDVGAPGGGVDMVYVDGLAAIAEAIRAWLRSELVLMGCDPDRVIRWTRHVAWAYTHFPTDSSVGGWTERMRSAGIAVRQSDRIGPWGTVTVESRAHARSLSTRAQPVAVCPAQLADAAGASLQCLDCGLCWDRPDVTVAFIAHGSRRKRAANWAAARFVAAS